MNVRSILLAAVPPAARSLASPAARRPRKVAVFGGTGYVGSAVCERLVKRGHEVTAVSRRGANPRPDSKELSQVTWVQGDATDMTTVEDVLEDSNAAVHCIGLLFDVDSGFANLNKIVSGSGSVPGEISTYDAITRKTAYNVIEAIEKKQSLHSGDVESDGDKRFPLAFLSAAEAGWPEVPLGGLVDGMAPKWLNRYLTAKRAVESRIGLSSQSKGSIRASIYRPSLIWDWTKYDILPAIPAFNAAAAVGVPFVDKTVRIETLADAIVAGIENGDVEGVQRVGEMEKLQDRIR
ncbi:hypothetical protein ACHAWF_002262 [Thalassiosira exigua]